MNRTSGFTVIEIAVALSVSALVVVAGRQVVNAVAQSAADVRVASGRHSAAVIGEDLLRGALRNALARADSGSMRGDSLSAFIVSLCPVSGGWLERCAYRLSISPTDREVALAMETGVRVVLRRDFNHASLLYLRRPEGAGDWSATWRGTEELPRALGMAIDGDTAIFAVGGSIATR